MIKILTGIMFALIVIGGGGGGQRRPASELSTFLIADLAH